MTMDPRDVRRGFFNAVRRIDKPVYVRDLLPEDTMEQIARAHRRKYGTYVFTEGERYIGRRPRR